MTKNIFTMRSENMSDTQMREVNRLASLGFEQSEGGMYEDTRAHILDSDRAQLMYFYEEMKGFALYSACLGGAAIELVGIVIDPKYQGHGLGSELLADFVENQNPDFLTAYTRNPSTVGLLNHYNGTYPLNRVSRLEQIASEMSGAELIDGAIYHVGRYGNDGLYGINDPAERSLRGDNIPMKERFQQLNEPGNALVLAAKMERGV